MGLHVINRAISVLDMCPNVSMMIGQCFQGVVDLVFRRLSQEAVETWPFLENFLGFE